MVEYGTGNCSDEDAILEGLIRIIEAMSPGRHEKLDNGIGSDVFLGADLGFKSLDFVRLAGLIRQEFNKRELPFQELFVSEDGRVVQDVQVRTLVKFLHKHF